MKNKKLKILCICNQGNSRSVGVRRRLNRRGYTNVIAIGGANTSEETMNMLCNWADVILLAKPTHSRFVLVGSEKIHPEFTIGEDNWNNPMHEELQKIVKEQLDKIKL